MDYDQDLTPCRDAVVTAFKNLASSDSALSFAKNLFSMCGTIYAYAQEYGRNKMVDAMSVSATTDYYRVNLMSNHSSLPYGLLYNSYTPASNNSTSGNASVFYTLQPVEARRSKNGHAKEWYYPKFTYNSAVYSGSNPAELHNKVWNSLLAMDMVLREGPTASLKALISYISGSWSDKRKALMDKYCAVYSELYEYNQGLFYQSASCTQGFYKSYLHNPAATVYSGSALREMYEPQPGDIILYKHDSKPNTMKHIGLVVWVDPDNPKRFCTIEGNSSSRVNMKCHTTSFNEIGCMVHLKYGGDADVESGSDAA